MKMLVGFSNYMYIMKKWNIFNFLLRGRWWILFCAFCNAAIVKIYSGNYDTTTAYNLDISNLDFTDISQLSKLCPDLVSLDVSGNKLKSLAGTNGPTKLEKSVLDGTSVLLAGIGKITSIQSLSIRNCGKSQLSSLIPDEFKN